MEYLEHPTGRRIFYERAGQGSPILFVHGWGTSSNVWGNQTDFFSKQYCTFAIDLAGHGKSSANTEGYTMDQMSDDLMFFINTLKLENLSLIGWSMGAMIMIKLLSKQKRGVNSLIFVSSSPKFVSDIEWQFGLPALIAKKLKRDLERNYASAIKTFNNLLFKGEKDASNYKSFIGNIIIPPQPEVALKTLEELEKSDLRNFLAPIDIPTLIIHGELDEICLPKASEFMQKKIKKSALKIMHGAAHMPFLTQPDKFNTIVSDFIK